MLLPEQCLGCADSTSPVEYFDKKSWCTIQHYSIYNYSLYKLIFIADNAYKVDTNLEIIP
jgi:hypothetical protein